MKNRGAPGSTLVEVLVVLSLFLMIMGIILSFYFKTSKINEQYETISRAYGNAVLIMKKLTGELVYADIINADGGVLTYKPLRDGSTLNMGFPAFAGGYKYIYLDKDGYVVKADAANQEKIFRLGSNGFLNFKLSESNKYLVITVKGATTGVRVKGQTFSLEERVHLLNDRVVR